MTYPDAVAKALRAKGVDAARVEAWLKDSLKMSLPQMREAAASLGAELVDQAGAVITAGQSSTGIMSAGVTETQFAAKH